MTTRRSESGLFGVLLVDKPEGPTSHDVVQAARRALGERRVGHTGTLDPFASGLLVLCVGRATRLAEYFHSLDKEYRALVRLGVETDTLDPEGAVVAESDAWRDLDAERVAGALDTLTGSVLQRPPAYSAKRVDGERAHRAARKGRDVELEPVRVEVHELEAVSIEIPEVEIRARVGTGTYVRALARDLGRALGCGAHLTRLRRTRTGPFEVGRAVDAAALDRADAPVGPGELGEAWYRPAGALAWLPTRELDGEEAAAVGHGSSVERGRIEAPRWVGSDGAASEPVVLLHDGRLVAVAEPRDGRLQPRKVFARAA